MIVGGRDDVVKNIATNCNKEFSILCYVDAFLN